MIKIEKLEKIMQRRLWLTIKNWSEIHKDKKLAQYSTWTKAETKKFAKDYGLTLAHTLREDMNRGYYCIDEIDIPFIDEYIAEDMSCWG